MSWKTRQLAILQPKVHHDAVPIPGPRHGCANVSVLRSYGYWGLQGLLRGMDKEVCSPNTYTFTHRHNVCLWGDTESVKAGEGRELSALRSSFGVSITGPLLSPGSHPLGWARFSFPPSWVSQAGHKPGPPKVRQDVLAPGGSS